LLATFRRPGSAHSEKRCDEPHMPLMKGGIRMAKKTVKKATKKAAKKR
jgi:hypothetical protein